jgi:predicted HAD superfamily Cof-like phosphohydrolase
VGQALADIFWLSRRGGAEDWEIVTDPVIAAGIERNEHFEIEECRRSAGLPISHPVQLDMVEFFASVGGEIGRTPELRRTGVNADLILEETRETVEAMTGVRLDFHFDGNHHDQPEQSLVAAIDGLCDLLATVYGYAVTIGVDLAPFWDEVHRTNLAKVGGPVREDGKRLKPDGWQPPNIAGLLERLYPGVVLDA